MTTGRSVLVAVLVGLLSLTARGTEPSQRQIGEVVLEGIPEIDPALRERMLQYLNVRRAVLLSIADDGQSVLIGTRFGDSQQVHRVSRPLGQRQQLTFYDEPVGSARFVPGSGGRKIVYSKQRGGDERHQFYLLDVTQGASTLLTDGTSRHTQAATLSRDGRRLAYTGTVRNARDFDVVMVDLESRERRTLLEGDGQYYAVEFSPDGQRLLVLRYVSEKETQWLALDVDTGRRTDLTPADPPLYYGSATWAPDGRSLYLTSDRASEFRQLYRLTLDTGTWECLTPDIDWDIDDVAVDPASGGLAFVVNDDGISRLCFADAAGQNRRYVTGLPVGVMGGLRFAERGGVVGFTLDSAVAPADAFTATYPQAEVTRWTESEVGGLDPATFIAPELIRYPTFDQVNGRPREIPAFYFRGRGAEPRPVIIFIHGGPETQYQPTFTSNFQFWTIELGASVLAPNIRGSTGYGRTYHQLDNGVLREDAIRDIGALLDWIATRPELDRTRVAVYGGSYGGYAVLASLAMYPERLRAGINVVGIASFISFLENTPDFRRDLRREEYGDERIPEVRAVLERISPLNNAHRIESALFVAHGKNDPRVPVSEAEQIVAKMRELGRPVWYAVALNEGHGFQKKPNMDLMATLYALFWQKHLLP